MSRSSKMEPRQLVCGLDFAAVTDVRTVLDQATSSGYEFVCIPIVHPRFKREFFTNPGKSRPGPFTRADLILSSQDWNVLVVGKICPYLDLESSDLERRRMSEHILNQELTYSTHLGLPAILIKLNRPDNINLARVMSAKLVSKSNCIRQVWVHIPITAISVAADYYRENRENEQEPNTWEWWNSFRSICNFDSKLGVALEITADLPSDQCISRWLGEPVKCLIISTEIFVTNKRGFPVLPKAHQSVIKTMAGIDVQIVVTGARRHESMKHYVQYLDHLWQQSAIITDPIYAYARGYEDYLQCPLQPLMDNLESQTYEVFEKDPIKYNEYQRAIYMTLLDRVPFEEKDTNIQTIMVVGAGRGPLVNAAINAANKADRRIRIYAVEKNPNAVVTLQMQQEEMWNSQVTVVSDDMRNWEPPELADILISELLGSFGDNELSPECLDGVQKCLKENGVSIPSKYTSYLSPIQSSKLYNEVRLLMKEKDKPPLSHFEAPYVVHQQNRFPIAPPQPVFTFIHPNRDEMNDNTRYVTLTFDVEVDSVLHGFSGYFDTVLYKDKEKDKDIMLSIVPETHSRGMFSWFPIFFPIKEPVYLKSGQKLVVHFWRLSDKKNVWYEWAVSSPVSLGIHNVNGRSYTIGL